MATKPQAKQIKTKLAYRLGPKTVAAYIIDAIWVAHDKDVPGRWTLTHRKTGYAAGTYPTFTQAKKAGIALTSIGPELWKFTDPQTVRNNPAFKDCRRIVREHGAD